VSNCERGEGIIGRGKRKVLTKTVEREEKVEDGKSATSVRVQKREKGKHRTSSSALFAKPSSVLNGP
jgi:hypothetical protein